MKTPAVIPSDTFDFQIRRFARVPLMRQAHRHHEVEVNFLEAGDVVYLIGGRLTRVPAGRFSFFWGSTPHQLMEATPTARGFWFVTIPLAWVMSWGLSPELLGRLLDGAMLCDRAARPADRLRLMEWQELLGRRDPRLHKPAVLELEARFRLFAIDHRHERSADAAAHASPAAHRQVERLARFVVEHYARPVTLADIAAAANLHPNYAANLFRKHCGQTLMQCLSQHRIAHAQRLLATTQEKVIDVAIDSGFGSLSRFYEAFGRACGTTPSAYRRQFGE